MKVGIYSRVSKDKKGEDRSLPYQEKDGIEWAKTNGHDYELYTEKEGTSGTLTSDYRPQFYKLLGDIKKGAIQFVYVYDLSRLERNEHDRFAIFAALREFNGKLYTNRDGFVDFQKPEIKLHLDIVSATNNYSVSLTRENVKGKLRENVINGRKHSAPAYGYMGDLNKKLVVNPETSPIIERIFQLSIDGNGGQTIAKILSNDGIPTPTSHVGKKVLTYRTKNLIDKVTVKKEGMKWNAGTITRILKNPLYKGDRHWNDEVYNITPIVSPEVWEMAQKAIEKNKNNSQNNTPHEYLLKGKITCGICGQGYHGYTQGKRGISVYQCYHRRIVNKVTGLKCTNKRVDKHSIEDILWQRVIGNPLLLKVLKEDFDFENLNNKVDYSKQIERVTDEMASLRSGRQTLIGMAARNVIEESDLEAQLPALNEELSVLKKRYEELTAEHEVIVNQKEVLSEVALFQQNLKRFENPPFDLKRKLVDIFIDKVTISHDKPNRLTELQIKLKLNLEYHALDEEFAIDLRQYKKNNLAAHEPALMYYEGEKDKISQKLNLAAHLPMSL